MVLSKYLMNEQMNEWGEKEVPKDHSCTITLSEGLLFVRLMSQTYSINYKLYNLRGLTLSSLKSWRSIGTLVKKGMALWSPSHCSCPTLTGTLSGKFNSETRGLKASIGGKGRGLGFSFFQFYFIIEFSVYEVS